MFAKHETPKNAPKHASAADEAKGQVTEVEAPLPEGLDDKNAGKTATLAAKVRRTIKGGKIDKAEVASLASAAVAENPGDGALLALAEKLRSCDTADDLTRACDGAKD